MTKTEKLLAVALSVVSGIAIVYIQKCKQLQVTNEIQSEQINNLWEFVNREDVDSPERDDYPFS
jgi:hypothetical protein